nr:hypothetical protein [Haloarcula quadrata]
MASDDGDGGTGGESGGASTGDSSSGQDFSGETLRVMVWSGNYADRFEETIKRLN